MREEGKRKPIEFEQLAPKTRQVLEITRWNSDFSFEFDTEVIGNVF
jgi:hypothetical protein